MKKICFIGRDNYPLLNPANGKEYFGGESVQQTLLAKAFRDKGYEVSMITKDHGQPDGEVVDGIKVWKMMRDGAGLPVVRFFHPRMTSLYRAFKNADADVYFQSCAGFFTGATAWYCNKNARKFIFRVAHDTDCIPGEYLIGRPYWRDSRIYEYGLKRADLISAQSTIQQDLLEKNYGLKSQLINMVVELPQEAEQAERDIDILWVNNIRPFKRPELAVQLARLVPEYRVVMIGGPIQGYEELYNSIKEESAGVDNLEYLGQVPYAKVNDYFQRTKVFINTSDSEGFPNSFLQAWIRGVPVFSFFDPDHLIDRNGLGEVPSDVNDMAARLNRLLADQGRLNQLSEKVKHHATAHYSPNSVVDKYIDWIESQ